MTGVKLHDLGQSRASELLNRRVLGRHSKSGAIHFAYTATTQFTNRHGTVQGGFLAAMLDSATAYALLLELPNDKTAVTRSICTSFLKPARPGEFFVSARVRTNDGRVATVEAELSREDSVVVAHAKAELRILSRRS